MKTGAGLNFIIFIIGFLVHTDFVGGNSVGAGILEADSSSTPFLAQASSTQISPLETTTTTTTTRSSEPPIKATTCPNATTILPCTCLKNSGFPIWDRKYETYERIVIACSGSTVDQRSVERSFREVRRVLEIPQDRGVYITSFQLSSTKLTQFDLAPLYGSRMDSLNIKYNRNLTKLVTSGNPQDYSSIHSKSFYIYDSAINREGFGEALKYFSAEMTSFSAPGIDLSYPNNNNSTEAEFLPGLSTLTNLTSLDLTNCKIGGPLTSSHFKQLPRLTRIFLDDNNINGIGENVFRSRARYTISLDGNRLNGTSIHPNSGIAKTGRETDLFLNSNRITTLPSEIFQPFLEAHPLNRLGLRGNPLMCDDRLSWLQSRQRQFQGLVKQAQCWNDPSHTVFDFHLIPKLNDSALLPTAREPPIRASTCPNASTISPCICYIRLALEIRCQGSAVNQTSIENTFGQVRRVNEIPEDRGVDMDGFILYMTEMTQLDLAPFYGSQMDHLEITSNYNLTKLVTSGNPQDHGSIHVKEVLLQSSPINREGFGDALKYFSNRTNTIEANQLDLDLGLNLNNSTDQLELLPGLSAFKNLTRLRLGSCNIRGSLNSSHLSPFPRLEKIELPNNQMDGIGENAFARNVWWIDLNGNNLTETSFHPNSGIAQVGRQKHLFLRSNQITTLPSAIFQPFLDAHPGSQKNRLLLSGNPLICDDRLKWLALRWVEFQVWVESANCRNDQGHNLFNSNLVYSK